MDESGIGHGLILMPGATKAKREDYQFFPKASFRITEKMRLARRVSGVFTERQKGALRVLRRIGSQRKASMGRRRRIVT
jgi:hypothetical protein